MERRLAAILAADVVGYSRLMDADEVDTFERLRAHRKELFEPEIRKYRGRIFKLMGDGLLAEFGSVVDAVECAAVLQRAMAHRNDGLAGNRRIDVRIGINLGDVMVEGDDLIGEGVNVAARLQGLAEPGGIHISGSVYDQVKNKLPLICEDLGAQSLRNIAGPVRVYRVQVRAGLRARDRPLVTATRLSFWSSRARTFAVLSAAALSAAAIAIYLLNQRPPLCTRAAIAILPFANLSGDSTQDYFSEGTTEDLTLALGRFSDLAVTANVAVQTYKGKPVRPSEISRDLGVCYILTGSTRKSGDRVLVTAELTDARNGQHLDSYSYDGELKDVFAVRDRIAQDVVGKLAIKLNDLERQRAFKKPTGSLEAYDYLLRGRDAYAHDTRSMNMEARKLFEQAIQIDRSFASAYAALGWTRLKAAISGWAEFREEALQQAEDMARKAIDIDYDNAEAHRLLGAVYFNRSQFDLAISEYDRAIALNPNDAASYVTRGSILTWTGHARDAIDSFAVARQLNPSLGSGRLEPVGWAYYLDRRYKDAVTAFEAGLHASPDDYFIHAGLAASYAQLGQQGDETRAAAATMHAFPFFEVNGFASQFQSAADRALIIEGLHRAGLN